MNGAEDPDDLTAAERALRERLQTMQVVAETPSTMLVPRIIRTARWQRALRHPLLAISGVGGAMIDSVRLLLGVSKRS